MPQRPLSKIKVIKAAFVKGKRINREEKKEENMAEQEKVGALPVEDSIKETPHKTPAGEKRKKIWERMKRGKQIYIMLLPVMLFYILFSYVPMYGIILAWKRYLPDMGILGSPDVGWKYFEQFFTRPAMFRALKNTLVISFLKLLFCFPAPIILAIFLNEVRVAKYRKLLQWMVYLPYFISWVVIGGLVKQMLAIDDGLFNNILAAFGKDRVAFLQTSSYFYPILILTELWKGMGWGTVIYIAAISGIDPCLYEAATIDGCKRFGHMRYITFPSLLPIITVMFILQLGNIMNAGFDSVYNLYNDTILDVSEIIDTLVYTEGIGGKQEFSTAVGLFKNVINFILLIGGNALTKKINGYSMYSLD